MQQAYAVQPPMSSCRPASPGPHRSGNPALRKPSAIYSQDFGRQNFLAACASKTAIVVSLDPELEEPPEAFARLVDAAEMGEGYRQYPHNSQKSRIFAQ